MKIFLFLSFFNYQKRVDFWLHLCIFHYTQTRRKFSAIAEV